MDRLCRSGSATGPVLRSGRPLLSLLSHHLSVVMTAVGMTDDEAVAEFRMLYFAVARDLVNRAMMLTGNWADAEDLVQASFQELWRRWNQLRHLERSQQRGWLWKVVANMATSVYRKQVRTIVVDPLGNSDMLDIRPSHGDPHDALLAKDLLDDCWTVIRNMPPVRRLVIVLWAYGDSTREIAARLGTTKSTVRGHRATAIRELRDKVGPFVTTGNAVAEDDGEETV